MMDFGWYRGDVTPVACLEQGFCGFSGKFNMTSWTGFDNRRYVLKHLFCIGCPNIEFQRNSSRSAGGVGKEGGNETIGGMDAKAIIAIVKAGEVSRLDSCKKTSACVYKRDVSLKLLCYCKTQPKKGGWRMTTKKGDAEAGGENKFACTCLGLSALAHFVIIL